MTTAPAPILRSPVRPTNVWLAGAAALVVAAVCTVALRTSPLGLVLALVAGLLVWLSALDIEYRLVPNRLVLPATVLVLGISSALVPAEALERLAASVGVAGFLLAAALARPGALGMGDVKLGLLIGAACGSAVMTALAIGFGAAGAAGLVLVIRDGRAALGRRLPLVPFLSLGAVAAFVLQ